MIITCPRCGAPNRLVEGADGKPLCGKCREPLPDRPAIRHVSEAEFDSLILGADRPVLVDFFATWCGPCRMLAPLLDAFACRYPQLQVLKVDTDESPSLSDRYAISMVPTLILFLKGKVQKRVSGAFSLSDLESHFEEWISKTS